VRVVQVFDRLVQVFDVALHNVELVFDTAISHLQFLVHISYESCRSVLVIQTVGKIIAFFAFTSMPKNKLVYLPSSSSATTSSVRHCIGGPPTESQMWRVSAIHTVHQLDSTG
jgi:hypothetical protein